VVDRRRWRYEHLHGVLVKWRTWVERDERTEREREKKTSEEREEFLQMIRFCVKNKHIGRRDLVRARLSCYRASSASTALDHHHMAQMFPHRDWILDVWSPSGNCDQLQFFCLAALLGPPVWARLPVLLFLPPCFHSNPLLAIY
jgi:hypothetical protein